MKYVKATGILPESLLAEIQKYVQGEAIYIPKAKVSHEKWGARSGGRKLLDERNRSIKSRFQAGTTIPQLAADYFLSTETIKKIVYTK